MGTIIRFTICALVVFESGSPTLAQFTTVINAPPTVIGNDQSIGSSTQLNVLDGGVVGRDFSAGAADGSSTHVELNVQGGTVGTGLNAYSGSVVNVSRGMIRNGFTAHSGSEVNISGGLVFPNFVAADSTVNISGGSVNMRAEAGSEVNILGGAIGNGFFVEAGSEARLFGAEFRLNGNLIPGLENVGDAIPVDLPFGSVLSGTFADGTPFAFSGFASDQFQTGTLTLQAANLPPVGPGLITIPVDQVPSGIRGGQTLIINEGGAVPSGFNAGPGSIVDIRGGNVGQSFEALGAEVFMSSGSIDRDFKAFNGSVVSISGGTINGDFLAFNHSVVNITGGLLANRFSAESSTVNLSGGIVRQLSASSAEVAVSGGDVGAIFGNEGSIVHISDGSIKSMNVALGSVANISGGFIEEFESGRSNALHNSVAIVNITGGTIGPRANAYSDSRVTISGGAIGDNFYAWHYAIVNISGGEIGNQFRAMAASEINISGGSIGQQFVIDSVVNISGGTFGNLLVTRFGRVHLLGKQFVLEGVDITSSLLAGDPLTITQRDVTLSGLLADGSPFSIDLNTTIDNTRDVFVSGSLLTVTLVPEPNTISFLLAAGLLGCYRRTC